MARKQHAKANKRYEEADILIIVMMAQLAVRIDRTKEVGRDLSVSVITVLLSNSD